MLTVSFVSYAYFTYTFSRPELLQISIKRKKA